MVASKAKPKRKPRPEPTPRKGSKTQAILTLATTTNATPPQIANAVKVSRQAVHDALKRYGVDANTLETFKNSRADILAASQAKDLETYLSLDPAERKSLIQKRGLVDMGISYDKERIERTGGDDNSRPLVMVIRGDNNQIAVGCTPKVDSKYPDASVVDIPPTCKVLD